MNSLIDEKNESLVAYYILPAVMMSYRAFGPYFKSAHIDRDHTAVMVTLVRGCKEEYWKNQFFQLDYDKNGCTYAVFRIPDSLRKDLDLFAEGKYSKMSDALKKRIYKHSGLLYNKQIDNLIVTDKRLLALTKSPILKQWVEETYKVKKGKNSEFIKLVNKESIYYD